MALLKTNTGIGTTNPTSALHVIGDGLFTGVVTATSFNGSINAGVGTFTNLTATNATLTNINSSGISTLGVTSVTRLTAQSINSSGIVTGSTFRPSTGYIQAADGTNSLYIYSGTGNVAFQGTIGASQINNAQGYKVIGFSGINDATFENNVYISGITTSVGGFVGNLTGTATTATKLQNARTFEITGDVVASAISFDGTGNVSLAATIQPNSVGLGTDTFGDYVRDITGTANEIEVTGGTGEGSTPQIGLPDNVIITNNLYVNGITTSAGGFVGALTGIAASATQLVTPRTFEITGDVVASPIFFDGTGNVSLAATIQPNSVGLGTDTTGSYVQSISGTSNQITVTGGTGEGSTPTLSIPNQFVVPQDIEVARDLQVNRNLNVNGNITIGGSSATLFSQELKIFDPDIVLGFRTDVFGNDVSNDNTANHGGVAVASTEGTPLVQLFIAGIETNPATYKKIMWFKAGEFAGLGTDAWLFNYAVGIGSTQFPSGTRLAAGAVQFTENDLAVVRNINASGIITAASFSGNASSATNADYINISVETSNDSTYYIPFESGIGYTSLYVDTALTYNPGQDLLGLTNIQGTKISLYEGINASGVITATTFNGQVNAGVGTITSLTGTNLNYGGVSTLGSVSATQLNVSGIITGTLANNLTLNTSGTGLSGSATYNNSGVTTFTVTSNATNVNTPNTIVARDASGNFSAGIINANLVGIASTATQLLTPRDFSITGNFVTASAVSFDGTGNVALAATITPNSIELGTYTSGNYVASITNGNYITGGDGGTEGAALTIGVAATSANTANQVVARDASGNFSAGTITANLTGTATTASFATTSYYLTDANNIISGTINVARLTGTYDIDINGNASSATNVIGGIGSITQLNVSGVSTLTGNVSFGSSAFFGDNDRLNFGDSNDLQIWHNGTNSLISDAGTGDLYIGGNNNVVIASAAFSEDKARFITNGAVELYYDNVKEFETTGYGATVFGILETQGLNVSGVSTTQILNVGTGGTVITTTSDGLVGINSTVPTRKLDIVGTTRVQSDALPQLETLLIGSTVKIQNTSSTDTIAPSVTLQQARNLSNFSFGDELGSVNYADQSSSIRSRIGFIKDTSGSAITLSANYAAGGSNALRNGIIIRESGNTGIGTTNPGAKLHIEGGTTTAGGEVNLIVRSSDLNSIPTTIATGDSNATLQVFAGGFASGSRRGGQIDFVAGVATTNPGTLIFRTGIATGGTSQPERVRIDASGNVGIGTTIPTGGLTIATVGSATTGASQIYLNGATSNRIDFNINGVAAPTFTTRSAGTKLVLYPFLNTTNVDYALGIDNNTLWYTVPQAINTQQHRWYAGTTQLADLKGTGELVLGGVTTLTGTANQTLQVSSGGAYIAGDTVNGVGLGIGVTNPAYPVDIRLNGSATTTPLVRIYPTTTTRPASIIYVNASSSNFFTGLLNSSGAVSAAGGLSGLTPYAAVVGNSAGTTPLLLVTNGLERVRVTDTGLVGIGTTNPEKPLHLLSSVPTPLIVQRVSAANAAIEYRNPTSSMWAGLAGNALGWGVAASDNVGANAQILVTRTGGELLVGTSTATGTASQRLQVTGGAYVSGSVGIGTTNPGSTLTVQGNAYITGVTTSTDFDSLSDINLKTNINQISDPLEKVMQIRGVTFDWKETNRGSAGVIAQEIEKVLPELVHGGETKTVNYNGLIGLLIECVKKQQEEIEQLKKLN